MERTREGVSLNVPGVGSLTGHGSGSVLLFGWLMALFIFAAVIIYASHVQFQTIAAQNEAVLRQLRLMAYMQSLQIPPDQRPWVPKPPELGR